MKQLKVTISKTAVGNSDYMQIMSDDFLATNIVLIADQIVVEDHRPDENIREVKTLLT